MGDVEYLTNIEYRMGLVKSLALTCVNYNLTFKIDFICTKLCFSEKSWLASGDASVNAIFPYSKKAWKWRYNESDKYSLQYIIINSTDSKLGEPF